MIVASSSESNRVGVESAIKRVEGGSSNELVEERVKREWATRNKQVHKIHETNEAMTPDTPSCLANIFRFKPLPLSLLSGLQIVLRAI